MNEPAISFLEEFHDSDPWTTAERVVCLLVAEANSAAESAPEFRTAYAYGVFRETAKREITALLERIQYLEEQLEDVNHDL